MVASWWGISYYPLFDLYFHWILTEDSRMDGRRRRKKRRRRKRRTKRMGRRRRKRRRPCLVLDFVPTN